MNKIICDVCGTSYPDTADQCPICGCAKPEEAGEVKSYTYVRGGRFSSKNVNKRLQEKQLSYAYSQPQAEEDEEEEPLRSNRGLLIAVVLLLLAILAIAAYLYLNYWMPSDPYAGSTSASTTVDAEPSGTVEAPATQDPTEVENTGACLSITLDTGSVTLSNAGDGYLINYILDPAETADTVSFSSSAPEIASVDENGKITALAPGSATITVTCGDATAVLEVTCNIETEPTEEPTEAPTTEPEPEFKLRTTDMTMTVSGPQWDLYTGPIPNTSVEWWSGDESVCTVDKGGVVTFVGEGTTKVYAKYNGVTYECIVRVKAE